MQEIAHARSGTLVRQHREAAGMSQQALASKAGVALRTIARIEAGEDTTLGTLAQIAAALTVSVVDLIGASVAS